MNSKMEKSSEKSNAIIYSQKLSLPLKDDSRSLFANVTRSKWIAPDENIIFFVRFELKLSRGVNLNPITLSLTATQVDWLVDCIERNLDTQIVPGEKSEKFICYEISDKITESVTVSVVEKNFKFGIVLDIFECSTLKYNYPFLSFLMKYQNPSGEKLKDLLRYIYSACIYKAMKNCISSKCNGCIDESLLEKSHSCKKETNDLINEHLFETLEGIQSIDEKFSDLFIHFVNILNIKDFNRNKAENILFLEIKEEEKEHKRILKEMFEPRRENLTSIAILRLIDMEENLVIPESLSIDDSDIQATYIESGTEPESKRKRN